ncbi:MAG TPA: hypothetical protein DCR48_08810 [Flavobacteriales bacterium]|nr:hypothetical protein [Flavobacteriales bacterium]
MIKILLAVIAIMLATGFMVSTQKSEDVPSEGNDFDESTGKINTVPEETEGAEMVKDENPEVSRSKVLDLNGQGLTKAPSYIFDKINTQELDLSNNKLEGSLQAEVRFLQNLKVLDLSNNKFTGVPAEIGQLKNLEVLNLSNNQLTGLPYELGNLSSLKVLNLKGNAYASADLDIIKQSLNASTVVLVD